MRYKLNCLRALILHRAGPKREEEQERRKWKSKEKQKE
jgi:hypothetical protein